MDQAVQVFQPTWHAMLLHFMKYAVLPIAFIVVGYAIYAKGIDVGLIILDVVFIVMFVVATVMACTTKIIISPMSVVSKNLFTEKSIPTPAIRRVQLEQGMPNSPIKMRSLLIETSEGKIRMGGVLSAEQIQEAVARILELIRIQYPRNYGAVQQYSNNPNLLVEKSLNFTQLIDGETGRVFAPSPKVKIILTFPFIIAALVLFVETQSFLALFLVAICAVPFLLDWAKKIVITSRSVTRKTLLSNQSIALDVIRMAKIETGLRGRSYLLIKTSNSKLKIGDVLLAGQLNDILAYLLEQIRINHPENYEAVKRSSSE